MQLNVAGDFVRSSAGEFDRFFTGVFDVKEGTGHVFAGDDFLNQAVFYVDIACHCRTANERTEDKDFFHGILLDFEGGLSVNYERFFTVLHKTRATISQALRVIALFVFIFAAGV